MPAAAGLAGRRSGGGERPATSGGDPSGSCGQSEEVVAMATGGQGGRPSAPSRPTLTDADADARLLAQPGKVPEAKAHPLRNFA